VDFGEAVNGFVLGDVTVTNGTANNFIDAGGGTFTFSVAPTADGNACVDLAIGVAQDAAGNLSNVATQSCITSDRTPPTPVISAAQTSPTNANPINYSVNFGELVNGFVLGDIAVTNGTASNFIDVGGGMFTFNLSPTADGQVCVDIAGGVAQDVAGNLNNTATQSCITSDRTPPTPVISTALISPTNANSINFTVDFGEAVNGFVLGDVTVTNGTANNFIDAGGGTFTFSVAPTADGNVCVDIAMGVAQDSAGNLNNVATQSCITSDRSPPTPVISAAPTSPTNANPINYSVNFGELVNGFVLGDIVVTNGTANNFVDAGGGMFTFSVAPTADGNVCVDIAMGVTQDAAGNLSNVATQSCITSDRTPPTPVISAAPTSPTNTNSIDYSVNFGETVNGFVLGDIAITNGTANNFIDAGGGMFTFNVSPTADGQVCVDVAGGVAQDVAGNLSNTAVQSCITSDRTPPTPVITTTQTSPTNASPINYSVNFGELVSGFVLGDVTVTNGTASNFIDAGGGTFTFSVAPTADGNVCVDIATGVAQDAAGNVNNVATQSCVTSDRTRPSSVIVFPANGGVFGPNTWTDSITGTASDATAGVSVVRVSIEDRTTNQFWNGTAFSGSNEQFLSAVGTTNWSFAFSDTNLTNGRTYRVRGQAADAAGNVESTSEATFTFDASRSVPVISGLASPIADTSFDLSIDFGESVNGFTLGDITVVNGTPTALVNNNDGTFTATVESTGDGIVSVNVAASAVQDLAGNNNVAASPYTVTVAAIKVSLDADGLHIEDLRSDAQDLTIQSDAATGVLIIKGGGQIAGLDPSLVGEATGDGTTQITVPLELVSGRQIIVTTNGGVDRVTVGPLIVAAEVSINANGGTSGMIVLDGPVSTTSFVVTANNININTTSLTTTAGQTYNGAVSLGADLTLTGGTTAAFSDAITGNGKSLTIAGNATFGGLVNAVSNLDIAGTTAINSPTIVTTGDQHFRGAITFGVSTTLTAGGGLTFDADISSVGATDLTIAGGGPALFRGNRINGGVITISASEIEFDVATGAKTLTAAGSVSFVTSKDALMNTLRINAGGNISVLAKTGILLGQLVTPADVTLESTAGAIADGNSTGFDISANHLQATAATGIGTAFVQAGRLVIIDPLETSVRTLDVVAHGLGAFIDNVPPSAASPEGAAHSWHNSKNPFDVNSDSNVSPVDVLQIVNHLSAFGSTALAEGESMLDKTHYYLDVNADDFATPLDALLVINYLNARIAGQAESESIGGGSVQLADDRAIPLLNNSSSSISDSALGDRSRRRESDAAPSSLRSDFFTTTPPPPATSYQPTGQQRPSLEADDDAQDWESLLDAIAEDTARWVQALRAS
jgi:hypothetical protein